MRHRSTLLLLAAVILAAVSWRSPATAQAAEIILTDPNTGAVDAYDGTTGSAIATPLIPGLTQAGALALSGNDLYVMYPLAGNVVIGEFNATTGATINPALVTGLSNSASGFAISGGNVFVTAERNAGPTSGSIAEYDLATGNPINTSLVTGLDMPVNLVVSGGDIFALGHGTSDSVSEYTTSGALVNASLVTGASLGYAITIAGNDLFVGYDVYSLTGTPLSVPLLHHPQQSGPFLGDEVVSGGVLYIATLGAGIAQYTLGGAAITALSTPGPIDEPLAFVVTPEPASWLMLAIGAAALVAIGRRRRRASA